MVKSLSSMTKASSNSSLSFLLSNITCIYSQWDRSMTMSYKLIIFNWNIQDVRMPIWVTMMKHISVWSIIGIYRMYIQNNSDNSKGFWSIISVFWCIGKRSYACPYGKQRVNTIYACPYGWRHGEAYMI